MLLFFRILMSFCYSKVIFKIKSTIFFLTKLYVVQYCNHTCIMKGKNEVLRWLWTNKWQTSSVQVNRQMIKIMIRIPLVPESKNRNQMKKLENMFISAKWKKNMYIYIYIYIYIYMSVCVYTYIYIYVYFFSLSHSGLNLTNAICLQEKLEWFILLPEIVMGSGKNEVIFCIYIFGFISTKCKILHEHLLFARSTNN